MTRQRLSPAILLFALLTLLICVTDASQKTRIKLRDIDVITLRHGQWTTGRRTRPVPQLACIGGTNRCKFLPQTVQCYNRGSNGQDIQWECKADMNTNLRFNKIDVTCEGYDFPEDDYVLVGSCGLEYSIDTVDGSTPFPQPHFNKPHPNSLPKRPKKDEPGFGTVLVLGIIASVMYLIYKNCIEPSDPERRARRRASPSAPSSPPPPGFMPGFAPDPCTSSSSSTTSDSSGFWSGMTWGGLAGYLLGSMNRNDSTPLHTPLHTHADPTQSTSSSSSWSFWGSSNVRQRHQATENTNEYRGQPDTGETRTASGFGETKRR